MNSSRPKEETASEPGNLRILYAMIIPYSEKL